MLQSERLLQEFPGGGTIDESVATFDANNKEERATAEFIAQRFRVYVRAVPRSSGRTPDALIGTRDEVLSGKGEEVEFKSLANQAGRARSGATGSGDPVTTALRQVDDSLRRGGQAKNIIIDGRSVRLTRDQAIEVLNRVGGNVYGRGGAGRYAGRIRSLMFITGDGRTIGSYYR